MQNYFPGPEQNQNKTMSVCGKGMLCVDEERDALSLHKQFGLTNPQNNGHKIAGIWFLFICFCALSWFY